MLRAVLTEAAIEETFAGLPVEAGGIFREEMGVTLFADGNEILMQNQILFVLAYGIIAVIVATLISRRRTVRDR